MEKKLLISNDKKSDKFLIIILFDIIIFILSLSIGRYSINVKDFLRLFYEKNETNIISNVIFNLRIPRTLVAVLIGAALSLSGAIYQGIFNNRLVSPDLLGVSSGASVGACIAILMNLSTIYINILAFFGGFFAVLLSIFIAKLFKNKSEIILLLSGIIISGLMSSIIGLIKYLADSDRKLAEMTYWLLGDISGVKMEHFYFMLPIISICVIVSLLFSFQVNAISLGKREALSLGINYNIIIIIYIICATLMTATVVSISGIIGWVGLSIPNIVRILFGNDNRKIFPFSILIGIGFMILVDMLSRSLAPNEIPISVITGILGTPIFIFALISNKVDIS